MELLQPMKNKEIEINKTKAVQTNLIGGPDYDKQMTKIDQEVAEQKAIQEGPFIVIIKKPDGTKEKHQAKTFWRLIFYLGLELEKKYSQLFDQGIILKIVRGSAGSD